MRKLSIQQKSRCSRQTGASPRPRIRCGVLVNAYSAVIIVRYHRRATPSLDGTSGGETDSFLEHFSHRSRLVARIWDPA